MDCVSAFTILYRSLFLSPQDNYMLMSLLQVRYEKVTAAVTTSIDDGSLTALTSASDEAMDTA